MSDMAMLTELVTATAMSAAAEVTVKAMLSSTGERLQQLVAAGERQQQLGTATATTTAMATAMAGEMAGVAATAAARDGDSFGYGNNGNNGNGDGDGDTVATMKAYLTVTLKAGANATADWVCSTAR